MNSIKIKISRQKAGRFSEVSSIMYNSIIDYAVVLGRIVIGIDSQYENNA